jgi:hypothetical protein
LADAQCPDGQSCSFYRHDTSSSAGLKYQNAYCWSRPSCPNSISKFWIGTYRTTSRFLGSSRVGGGWSPDEYWR